MRPGYVHKAMLVCGERLCVLQLAAYLIAENLVPVDLAPGDGQRAS